MAAVALLLASCSKDNRASKDLEGDWQIDYQWTGDANTLPDAFTNEGTLSFEKCKTTKETCFGQYRGEEDVDITFEWSVSQDGEAMNFNVPDNNHWMYQFHGDWELFSQTDSKVVLVSSSCIGLSLIHI